MTKKNYIAPEMTVCLVETQAFIAASQFGEPEKSNQQTTPTTEEYGGKFQTRHNDIWAEDEEDY